MRQFTYTIKAPDGIHAIPAGLLAQEAQKYDSFITITKNSTETDITKILKVMSMSIALGDSITVIIEGNDEDTAAKRLEDFFHRYL